MEPREQQALDAAKLSYLNGLSQDDVAQRLGVSRPTVSKLIQIAKDLHYVTIDVHDPREVTSEIGEQLREHFGLAEVRVAAGPIALDTTLVELDYFSPDELDFLMQHAAGDVCSRFYEDGKVCLPSLDARTVPVPLDSLRATPQRVCIAGGARRCGRWPSPCQRGSSPTWPPTPPPLKECLTTSDAPAPSLGPLTR